VVKTGKGSDAPPKPDGLRDMQMHTFSTLKRLHDESEKSKKYAEELRKGDATRAAAPFYLVRTSAFAMPNCRRMHAGWS